MVNTKFNTGQDPMIRALAIQLRRNLRKMARTKVKVPGCVCWLHYANLIADGNYSDLLLLCDVFRDAKAHKLVYLTVFLRVQFNVVQVSL
jgi:hypothetical protein